MDKTRVSIDKNSDVPLYKQIAYEITSSVLSSKLRAGEKLPSVRKFARLLDVDPNTIQKSYAFLKDEGVIYSDAGIGFFVARGAKELRLNKREEIVKKLKEIIKEARAAGFWTEDLFNIIDEIYSSK